MKKWLIIAGAAVLALFVTLLSAWLWMIHTESGARWALARAGGFLEQLEYEELSGALSSDLVIDGLILSQAGTRLEADRLELAVRIELFNGPRVLVRHLRGSGIDIYLPQEESSPEEPAQPFDLATLASPVEVAVSELNLRSLTVHAGAEPTEFQSIELVGTYGDRIDIESLDIQTTDANVQASGQWALQNRGSGNLRIQASSSLDENTRQSVQLDVSGRLDALDIEATSRGPAGFTGSGNLRGLPESMTLEARIEGGLEGWPGLPVNIRDARLSVSGEPGNWQAQSQARVTGPDIPEGQWSVALSGDTHALRIETLDADVLGGQINGDGSLNWSASAPASQARLQFESIDLTPLYPQWPNQGRLSGTVDLATQGGVIELRDLQMSADPGQLSVSGSGRIDPDADRVDLSLQWQSFAWPPVSDDSDPLVSSESGSIRLEGQISDWRAEVKALMNAPRSPSARVELEARGSGEQATIERLSIDAGEAGSLQLDGELSWSPQLTADVSVNLTDFDPGVLVHQLPGKVDGRARIRMAMGEQSRVDVSFDQLGGQLRGQPLSGSGEFALVDNQPQSADLSLQLGENRLGLSNCGQAAWQVDLDAIALGQLWPTLEGKAQLAGSFDPEAGRARLEGEVADLRYEQYNVEQALVNLDVGWMDQPKINLEIEASNFDLRPWDRLDTLTLSLTGSCAEHRLEVDAEGGRGQIGLAASGRMDDCLDSDARSWAGQVSELSLTETVAGDWRLDEALALRVSAGQVEAGTACLTEWGGSPARLCLEALSMGPSNRVVTRIEQVPMDLLLLPLDPVFSLTTPLSGRIEAGWDAAGLSQVEGELELGAGALKAIGTDRDLLAIDSLRLDLRPGETTDLRVDLSARLEGNSTITGSATVADLSMLAATQLDGQAQLDLPNIAAFAQLVPRIDRIGGSVVGRIEVDGPVSGPSVSGRMALHDGVLVHAPLGLDVRAIELELSGSDKRAALNGRAESGEGELELSGEGRLLDSGWAFDTSIEGRRFAFAGADWLELTASPQVTLRGEPGEVRIDGDIRIDRLRAGLPPGSADRVQPSDDVEVLGEEDDETTESAAPARRVLGRLGIDLGEDARLATDGLQTELAGALELIWDGPPRPRGRGTIRLPDGSYRAYGQNLEISGGEIVFSGQAIDNPRLDIRAVRDIFGDPEVDTAGVRISGSARSPDIQLYTDPPTSEDTALAYILTGSDFDHAGGQGALSVGLYILPRLFVSYGVGLFETGNVLSGRYEFSRHWGVRVVSGERDTGVDLSYTVNN